MASVQISKKQMLKRVARFSALQPSRQAFVDSHIPGHERAIFNVIGRGVTEDASLRTHGRGRRGRPTMRCS